MQRNLTVDSLNFVLCDTSGCTEKVDLLPNTICFQTTFTLYNLFKPISYEIAVSCLMYKCR